MTLTILVAHTIDAERVVRVGPRVDGSDRVSRGVRQRAGTVCERDVLGRGRGGGARARGTGGAMSDDPMSDVVLARWLRERNEARRARDQYRAERDAARAALREVERIHIGFGTHDQLEDVRHVLVVVRRALGESG